MPSSPFFSIVIPAYNRADLIGVTLDSLLTQSFRDFEIIVVDDGSTDNTPEVLAFYGTKITAIRQENRGAEAARHNGANHAQGMYLVLFDSDDILLPGALAIYHRVIQSSDFPPVVIASLRRFQAGDSLPSEDLGASIVEYLKYTNFYHRDRGLVNATPQLVVRRSIAQEHHLFHSGPTAWPFEPCDFMLTLGCCGPCVAISSPTTVAYRIHPGNDSGDFAYAIRMTPRFHGRERTGFYPGGSRMRFARYSYLGGIQFGYLRQSLRSRKFDLAAAVVRESWAMLLAAVVRKCLLPFEQKIVPIKIEPLTQPSVQN